MKECDNKCDKCPVGIMIEWMKNKPEIEHVLKKPEIVESLQMAIVEFGSGLIVIPFVGTAMSSIAQMSFLMGYKHAMETTELEKLHNKEVK